MGWLSIVGSLVFYQSLTDTCGTFLNQHYLLSRFQLLFHVFPRKSLSSSTSKFQKKKTIMTEMNEGASVYKFD
jgi:hypothetical protein